MSLGWLGGSPASSFTIAAAQTFACALAANADLGMPPAMIASPSTWMFGTRLDSNVTGSIGHQPVLSATPATWARRAALREGVTLAPITLWTTTSEVNGLSDGSTNVHMAH